MCRWDEAEFSPQVMRELPMLTSVRSLLAATALAGAIAATPALAQEEEATPSVTVTGSATITSDYRFRAPASDR